MKTTKTILILILLFAAGNIADANAQGWLERLGKKAEETAKRSVERKLEEKVDKAVDNAIDKTEDQAKQKMQKKSKSNKPIVEPPLTGTPAQNTSDWDNNEPYYALKKGTVITYTNYDGKGKVEYYSKSEILDISRTKSSVKAVVSSTQTDSKGKITNSGRVSFKAVNGNFYVDILSIMPPKGFEGAVVDGSASGNDMVIPLKLKSGQSLPDAEITLNMNMSSSGSTVDLPSIDIYCYNRRVIQAENVDTPAGKFLCYKIVQTEEFDLPIIGTKRYTIITWMNKGLGNVKSEYYDAKGKLQGRMIITEIK